MIYCSVNALVASSLWQSRQQAGQFLDNGLEPKADADLRQLSKQFSTINVDKSA
jgi:hypothetical protein